MKHYDPVIPPKVLERAKEIGMEQGYLPVSPFSVDADSNTTLCAAACLAYAGWESQSQVAAKSFLTSLVADRSDSVLYEAFEQLNWPRNLCEDVRIENDKSAPELRLSTFLSTCTILQEEAYSLA